MVKYELTNEFIVRIGFIFYRIRALKDFGDVKKGDLGGYVKSESNLSQEGDCWIYDNAIVSDNAKVYGNAKVYESAKVYYNAEIYGNAEVFGNAKVGGNAKVYDNAEICGNAIVAGNAKVFGDSEIFGCARVYGGAEVFDQAVVCGDAEIAGDAKVYGDVEVYGKAEITGNAKIINDFDYIVFKNTWSSGRYFTYTKSNKMWSVGCFYGTGDELITKAYKDSKLSGDCYKEYVEFVKRLEMIETNF